MWAGRQRASGRSPPVAPRLAQVPTRPRAANASAAFSPSFHPHRESLPPRPQDARQVVEQLAARPQGGGALARRGHLPEPLAPRAARRVPDVVALLGEHQLAVRERVAVARGRGPGRSIGRLRREGPAPAGRRPPAPGRRGTPPGSSPSGSGGGASRPRSRAPSRSPAPRSSPRGRAGGASAPQRPRRRAGSCAGAAPAGRPSRAGSRARPHPSVIGFHAGIDRAVRPMRMTRRFLHGLDPGGTRDGVPGCHRIVRLPSNHQFVNDSSPRRAPRRPAATTSDETGLLDAAIQGRRRRVGRPAHRSRPPALLTIGPVPRNAPAPDERILSVDRLGSLEDVPRTG